MHHRNAKLYKIHQNGIVSIDKKPGSVDPFYSTSEKFVHLFLLKKTIRETRYQITLTPMQARTRIQTHTHTHTHSHTLTHTLTHRETDSEIK